MILQKRAARKITSADFIQLEKPTEETSPESEKIVEKRERERKCREVYVAKGLEC